MEYFKSLSDVAYSVLSNFFDWSHYVRSLSDTKPIEEIKVKEFLTVRDVSKLLSCSIRTAYRLIHQGNINAVNLAERKTLVKRSDIDKLFEPPTPITPQPASYTEPVKYEIDDCYTTNEVFEKFNISSGALRTLIERNDIPKIRKGKFAYLPKTIIDYLLR